MKEIESVKAKFKDKILTDQRWLERAILAIYNRQTEDEKTQEATLKHNKVGFTGADARLLSYYASWILKGNHLSGVHVERARKRIVKYAGQLADIAKGKTL